MKLQLSHGIKMGLAVEFDEKSFKNAIIKLRDDPKLSKRMEEIMSANICHEEVLT